MRQQHGRTHEIAQGDEYRPSVQNNGTQLDRHRTTNFSTGLTANVSAANKRIDVILANHDHTGDTGDGGRTLTNITTVTSAHTATTSNETILCDASGGAFTVTLPAASGNSSLFYYIIKIEGSANAVTIDANGSETISGKLTLVLGAFDGARITCNGSNWFIG